MPKVSFHAFMAEKTRLFKPEMLTVAEQYNLLLL